MATSNSTEDGLRVLFKWPEYLVFSLVLLMSAAIGVYYGFFGSKQKTTNEFLMANRQMGTFPVAMSLIARYNKFFSFQIFTRVLNTIFFPYSFLSAVTLLGTPTEMYLYGTQYWVIALSFILVMASSAYLYMPVFYELQVTSAYEVGFKSAIDLPFNKAFI